MEETQEPEEYASYIVVNNDLNMSKGKIASQVGHITESIAERAMKIMYESTKSKEFVIDYMKYAKSGRKKIILKGTQEELEELSKEKDAEFIIDAGRTEIAPGSLTVVGFLPSNKNKERFKKFRLL
jgi:PTH2 family peptidyl-tRNA hydrolase